MSFPSVPAPVSGERFTVTYALLASDEADARERATGVLLEQTVELPMSLVPEGDIKQQLIGHIESLRQVEPGRYEAAISYPVEASGFEYTQLLNVMFGNISMQSGVRVVNVDLPEVLLKAFKGPRFGTPGLRRLLDAPTRPLLGTALKPLGYPPEELAKAAYQFARGGIDVIKDDHGLANQQYAPFKERAARCAEAVLKANAETGGHTLYAPNITGPVERLFENAHYAKSVGAGAVEVIAGLAGFDAVRALAADDALGLPVLSHPAFAGSYITSKDSGIAMDVIYGLMPRLAGADITIYVNFGGRFPITREDVGRLRDAIRKPLGHLAPILPHPGGGMTMQTIPAILEFYGNDIIFLVSGGLYALGPDLAENARRFRETVEQAGAG